MISYEQAKDWCKNKHNQKIIVLAVCFVLMFLVGYGTGSYRRETAAYSYKQNNYTTQTAKKPVTEGDNQADLGQGIVAGAATTTSSSCLIKGNISASTGKKVYHMPGGEYYKKVKPEQCFDTEAEALAAGFVKSSR